MKILFLAQILPYPLDSGVKIRSYYMLRRLAERNDVTLACFVRADNTADQVAHLREFCRAVYTVPVRRSRVKDARYLLDSMLRNTSFIISRDTVPAMQATVDGLLREAAAAGRPYDAVHSDQLWMAQYALRARGIRKVLDQHNAAYLIPQRMAATRHDPLTRLGLRWEARKLARYEAATCRRFDHVITVTPQDRAALEALMPDGRPPMTVVPICVDPRTTEVVPREGAGQTALHLGTMYWPPNVEGVLWFGREILPLVRREVPGARFVIVGKNPPASVQALAQDEGVEVAGYVADPRPYLARSAAFTVPLHAGGGMRVKILDGWLWGQPVVSTSIGAEGIAYRDGENILIADDAASFAAAVARLMLDRGRADCLAENGRRWVETRYDWRSVYEAVTGIYAGLGERA